MNQEIDKTIEKIERDLTENEQPLPKAAPTQRGINCPSHEERLYLFKAECCKCTFQIRQEYSQIPECLASIDAAAEHTVACRHKIEYVFISRMTGRSVSNVFLPPKPAWVHWLDKYQFLPIGCVIAFLFTIFQGWQSLPFNLFTGTTGAWIGQRIYLKWIQPKVIREAENTASET